MLTMGRSPDAVALGHTPQSRRRASICVRAAALRCNRGRDEAATRGQPARLGHDAALTRLAAERRS